MYHRSEKTSSRNSPISVISTPCITPKSPPPRVLSEYILPTADGGKNSGCERCPRFVPRPQLMYIQRVYMCRDGGRRAVMSPVFIEPVAPLDLSVIDCNSDAKLSPHKTVEKTIFLGNTNYSDTTSPYFPSSVSCLIGPVHGNVKEPERDNVGSGDGSFGVPLRDTHHQQHCPGSNTETATVPSPSGPCQIDLAVACCLCNAFSAHAICIDISNRNSFSGSPPPIELLSPYPPHHCNSAKFSARANRQDMGVGCHPFSRGPRTIAHRPKSFPCKLQESSVHSRCNLRAKYSARQITWFGDKVRGGTADSRILLSHTSRHPRSLLYAHQPRR
jgi:hypothetical protein